MHGHDHSVKGIRRLAIALGLTAALFIVELVGGFLTNSLALLTDSLHMLNDAFALAFAIVAAWLAQQPITMRKTYGYYRAEVLAALLNGVFLWIVVAFIFYEAFQRILHPAAVESLEMLAIAVLGLIANALSAMTLSGSKDESLNVKGAFLHVVADTLGSIGAISAGVIMYFTGWYQADPVISVMIGLLILPSSVRLVRESLNVLLEGVPSQIDMDMLERRIAGLKGVRGVHDLHAWCITPNRCILSAHVVVEKGTNGKKLTATLIDMLEKEFGIDHTTIQLEGEDYPKAGNEH